MNKPDRRTQKTKKAVYQAVVELLHSKRYDQIPVQEIIDRANIGRTTFYSHFPTKDDLLIAYMDDIFESLNDPLLKDVEKDSQREQIVPVAELFSHIEKNSRQIKSLMRSGIADLLFEKFKNYWRPRIQEQLVARYQSAESLAIPMQLLTAHATSTLVELAKWWVETKMSYTPEQMELYYWQLLLPCIPIASHR